MLFVGGRVGGWVDQDAAQVGLLGMGKAITHTLHVSGRGGVHMAEGQAQDAQQVGAYRGQGSGNRLCARVYCMYHGAGWQWLGNGAQVAYQVGSSVEREGRSHQKQGPQSGSGVC